MRGVGSDDPPLAGRRALPNRQPAAKPHPRSAWALANPHPGPPRSRSAARQARTPDPEQEDDRPSRQTVGQPGADRVRELEHALSGPVAEPPRDLAAVRAHTIETLERALAALQAYRAAPAPNQDRAALSLASPSDAAYTAGPAPQPGTLAMVPKQRPAKRRLSQEEKAAIIGRALSRQRPPKRRWP